MMIVVLISYGRGRFSANEEEVVDNVRQFQLLPHARCGGGSKLNPCKRNVEHCCPSFQKLIWVVHLVVVDVMASPPERARMMTRCLVGRTHVSFERVSVEVQVVAYVHVVVVTPASPSALALLGGRELEANALVASPHNISLEGG